MARSATAGGKGGIGAAGADPGRKGMSTGRKLLLVGVAVASLAAGGVGLWFGLGLFKSGTDEAAAQEHVAAGAEGDHAAEGAAANVVGVPGGSAMLTLDDMILNIRGTSAAGRETSRLMRISLTLVYDAAYDGIAAPTPAEGDHGVANGAPQANPAGAMAAKTPFLRDAFLEYLRQLTDRDLDGTLGLSTAKAELLKRARAVVGGDAPREVLIGDLVIQ